MMNSPAWIFDGSVLPDLHGKGDLAVKFLKLLKHPKSQAKGQAFEVWPFMERIVRRVYGDTRPDGQRRVKTVFLMLPRGNRKTTLGAGLVMLHTIGPERINGGYAVSAAVDREQARIAYDEAVGMLQVHPRLMRATNIRDTKSLIEHPKSGSVYHAVSSDGAAQHGKTPTFVLADELHTWRKADLWNALRTGVVKTPNSITWIITTAGKGQMNLAYDLYKYAKAIDAGEIEDEAFLPILFESPPDVDWRSEEAWRAVNPGLEHGFPDIDGLRQLAREAENRPGEREAFMQFNLNVWLDGAAAPWLDMALYDASGLDPVDLAALEGEPCYVGVDLSSTEDLTAVVAVFPRPDGTAIVAPFFFVPEASLRKRQERDSVPYLRWRDEGHIVATPGNVVDYDIVEGRIADLAERFNVLEILIDRWNATGTMNRLSAMGLPVVRFGQGYASMNAAVKATERTILSGNLRHGGHPVLRWNFQNVTIERDPAGNEKFNKARSAEKIDGAVACAMALARATSGENGPSIYDTEEGAEGLLVL